ncbi:unnamed protein product [Sphagnum jensenii]|uniref:Uncharacterized protein n=1 Tax=Sphagnum jensenii TaxID=128206 RepID=A0ABP0VR46_9BRYO
MLHDYLMPQSVVSSEITDDELDAWRVEVKKWARLFALKVVSFESQLQLIQVVSTPASENETGAEVQVGCYEALIVVCAALAITLSPSVAVSVVATTWVVKETPLLDYLNVSSMVDGLVDGLVSGLLANVELILQKGPLARSCHAVLARLKWGFLENLLSIAKSSLLKPTDDNDSQQPFDSSGSAIKDHTLEAVAQDAINSLESAGEYILPILCCIHLLMRRWYGLQETKSQVMWELVSSAWAAMANSNKRTVAPITAFLSSIFHPSIFLDVEMHEVNGNDGPLKWVLFLTKMKLHTLLEYQQMTIAIITRDSMKTRTGEVGSNSWTPEDLSQ